jgi:hypothetical protein
VVLGATDTQALTYFGAPQKVTLVPDASGDPGALKIVQFSTARLGFQKRSDGTYQLIQIVIENSASRTDKGIRVGSILNDVVSAYGDYYEAFAKSGFPPNQVLLECVLIEAYTGSSAGALVSLSFDYLNQGIEFNFSSIQRNVPVVLRVFSITVVPSVPCVQSPR